MTLTPNCKKNESIRIAATYTIMFVVVSSSILVLVSPFQVKGAPLASTNKVDNSSNSSNSHPSSYLTYQAIDGSLSQSTHSAAVLPSVLSQDGSDFTTQATISSLTARPTNNLVNTISFYDVVFLTSSSGAIKTVQVTFPAGTTIPPGAFFNEAEGIGPGIASKSGQTITYTVTNAVNVPVGTKIRLEFANINNPLQVSANYKVTVTTRDASNTIIDGPTESMAYTIKQIGKNAIANSAITTPKIADNSITSTKPNQNFMKRVTLTDNAAGNNLGWNPNGAATQFAITETALSTDTSSYVSVFVENFAAPFPNCIVTSINSNVDVFNIACNSAPVNGAQLNYIVEILPANVS